MLARDAEDELIKSLESLTINQIQKDIFETNNIREFVNTKDEAEILLKPLLRDKSNYKKVSLSEKSFNKESAVIVANALKNNEKTLKDVDISDTISGRPEQEALETLKIISNGLSNANLSRLNISNNALGEKGLVACGSLLQSQKALEMLSLKNIGCSAEACEFIYKNVQSRHLKELYLLNNMSGNKGAEFIAKLIDPSEDLERFQMSSSRIGNEGMDMLLNALCKHNKLKEVDISGNPTSEDIAPKILELIKNNNNIEILKLDDLALTDEGIEVIVKEMPKYIPRIEVLNMSLNEITDVGAEAIANVIPYLQKLKKLLLAENEMTDEGKEKLRKAIKQQKNDFELNVEDEMDVE